jgi:hypothetical protein
MPAYDLIALAAYGLAFLVFTLIVGRVLRARGGVFLGQTFEDQPKVAESVDFLLALGFYLLCTGLLLWNLGISPFQIDSVQKVVQEVALRLGISIFVVAAFHSLNILVLSVLNRRSR